MVGLDGVKDLRVFLIFPADVHANLDVGAFNLVAQRLADVMQQAGTLCHGHIHTQLCGHDARQMGYFDGVIQYVLSVRGAVVEPP